MDDSLASMAAAGAFIARANPALPGVPAAIRDEVGALGERYDMASHLRTDLENPNRKLLTNRTVIEYLIDRVGVVGSAADWLTRIAQLKNRGVENILCIGASGDKDRLIDLVGRQVVSALGGSTGPIAFAPDRGVAR